MVSFTEIDEPFEHDVFPIELLPLAHTPTGEEIVFGSECEDPTVVYPPGTIELLVHEACRHRHSTPPAFPAVKL